MIEGVIAYLVGNSIEAIKLRNTFVFKERFESEKVK